MAVHDSAEPLDNLVFGNLVYAQTVKISNNDKNNNSSNGGYYQDNKKPMCALCNGTHKTHSCMKYNTESASLNAGLCITCCGNHKDKDNSIVTEGNPKCNFRYCWCCDKPFYICDRLNLDKE